jgi:polyhydroxybutyrate depolymerase
LTSVVATLSLALLACSGAGAAGPVGQAGAGTSSSGASSSTDASASDPVSADAGAIEPTQPTPTPTAGCGSVGGATGLLSKMLTVDGVSRRYQLFVPPGYDPSRATRLVFVFHGLGGSSEQIRLYLNLESLSGNDAIYAYPDGVIRYQGRTGWDLQDLKLVDAMVADISASRCIDSKRIFATGHSFGGYMSNLVGCERGDVVRAIAPVSGGFIPASCKGPVAAWIAHGDQDPTVAQSEGVAARDHWTSANGCATTTQPTTPGACVAYNGCTAGHPVTWCSFSGGHFPLPAYTRQAIWDFIKVL